MTIASAIGAAPKKGPWNGALLHFCQPRLTRALRRPDQRDEFELEFDELLELEFEELFELELDELLELEFDELLDELLELEFEELLLARMIWPCSAVTTSVARSTGALRPA